jgi:hypothetical protein
MDQLAVPMLADHDGEPGPGVAQGHHDLPAVPECDNHGAARLPERLDAVGVQRPETQRPTERTDRRVTDRGQHRQL